MEVLGHDDAIKTLKAEVETLIEEKKALSLESTDLHLLKASLEKALANL